MATEGARHLHVLVDTETGERREFEDGCPECAELKRELARQRTIIANLRRDKDAEARAHELWPQAVHLFSEWKIASGHSRSRWREDRFWTCQPYLAKDGFVICRWAVWGVALMPNSKVIAHGHVETYDDFDLPFRTSTHFERYAKRGYAHPEARRLYSLKAQGLGEDDERINPHKHFEKK